MTKAEIDRFFDPDVARNDQMIIAATLERNSKNKKPSLKKLYRESLIKDSDIDNYVEQFKTERGE